MTDMDNYLVPLESSAETREVRVCFPGRWFYLRQKLSNYMSETYISSDFLKYS